MSAQPDATILNGFECCQDGGYRTATCPYCPYAGERPKCLVVTGNLAAARARLEATTPDDVKQAAVGLLAEPSHLDRLAAWAQAHGTVKIGGGYVRAWESYPGYADLREESLPDVQEAARRVLARLEAQ